MRIGYIGNRKNLASDGKSFNTENHIALTLEKLGHKVDFIQEDELEIGTLARRANGADLLLWTRTWPGRVTLEDLRELEALNIPTASFHLDKYTGIQRDGGLANDVFWRTQYVFSPEGSPESAEIFKSHGINQIYLPAGVFEDECYIAEPIEKFKYDIVFVGGGIEYSHPEWPYRSQLVTWLKETYGDRFVKYGWPERPIRGRELNELYASAKIVIGDSLCKDFKDSYYWSDRVYETIGRGGFIIHPHIKGMEDEFTDGENIAFYQFNNWNQLKHKIDYYLSHDQEREDIRLAGHKFVKNNCTYTKRLTSMLEIIFANSKDINRPSYTTNQPLKISLGAGTEIDEEEGVTWVNTDIISLPGIDVVHNLLNYPWPFEDNCADLIKAKDIIEHMPSHLSSGQNGIIAFIEEAHRILKSGGKLWIQTPAWDADFLWIDPTHVRGFDERSFDFFDPDTDFGRSTGFYSEAKFKVAASKSANKNLIFEMVKI